jgi:hypothetical protein
MFCPKCSLPQTAEDLRYCPRCGFAVREVKELVARDASRGDGETGGAASLPAQRDIATGALLMFAGCVVAVFWGFMGLRWRPEIALPQAYFIMGGTLAFILTLFRPLLGALERLFSGGAAPPARARGRRGGLDIGALLMFVGALKATLLTSIMPPGAEKGLTTLAIMAGMLVVVLLLRPVLRAAHALFFKGDPRADSRPDADATARLDPATAAGALPHARAVPADDFAHARTDTAELVAPPSVAEETTRKLGDL